MYVAGLSFLGILRIFTRGKNRPIEKHVESHFIAPNPHPWTDFNGVYVM